MEEPSTPERPGTRTSYRIGFVHSAETAAVGITVLVILALLVPVRRLLETRDIDQFEVEARLIRSEVEDFFGIHYQMAAQIPSRTRIREELVRLDSGEISLTEYRSFTDPKLGDAVAATDDIIAAVRYDHSGRLVAAANPLGLDVPDRLDAHERSDGAPVTRYGGTVEGNAGSIRYYVIAIPVVEPGEPVIGYDLVALSLETLYPRLVESVRSSSAGSIDLLHRDSPVPVLSTTTGLPGPLDVSGERENGGGNTDADSLARAFTITGGWTIRVSQARSELFTDTRRDISILIGVTAVFGIAIFLLFRWVAAVLVERSSAERAELESIVAERTSRLTALLHERDVLLREVHHRIKNDMSMVQSVLALQRHDASTEGEQRAFADAESRVGLMSEIYDLLYRTEDFGTVRIRPVLTNLLTRVVDSHHLGEPRIDLSIEVDDLVLPRRVAGSLGMIINELVINAIKYGCDPEEPRITVTFRSDGNHPDRHAPEGDAANEIYLLEVADNGAGFPEDVKAGRWGFGLEMVNAFIADYDGAVTFPEPDEGGATTFPGTIRIAMVVPDGAAGV
ncbi:MAG: sensor histidine kinase [Alkalispirochaeta sp.]